MGHPSWCSVGSGNPIKTVQLYFSNCMTRLAGYPAFPFGLLRAQPLLLRDTLQEVVVVFNDPDCNPVSKCSFIVQVIHHIPALASLLCWQVLPS